MPHDRVAELHRTRAKGLRRVMTRSETLLWRQLKAHRLAGHGFRRQTPMGRYIVDFVSHRSKLIVELDGESHGFEQQILFDRSRDEWFLSRGYQVLRFTNDEVLKNLEGVVAAIAQAVSSLVPPSLTLPRKGGGNSQRLGV